MALSSGFSLLACIAATEGPAVPLTFEGEREPTDASVRDENDERDDETDASDADEHADAPSRDLIPVQSFASIDAFCSEQVARAAHVDGRGACSEDRDALRSAVTFVREPIRELSAVTVLVGAWTETHLIVRMNEGWKVVRAPMAAREIDADADRSEAIAEVHVDTARDGSVALVAVTSKTDGSDMARSVRACDLSNTQEGIDCGLPVVIDRTRFETRDVPIVLFATDYEVIDPLIVVPEEEDE